jgi:hypothetical protein
LLFDVLGCTRFEPLDTCGLSSIFITQGHVGYVCSMPVLGSVSSAGLCSLGGIVTFMLFSAVFSLDEAG